MEYDPTTAHAITIFRELGWDHATFDATPSLPLGTTEQQQIALASLQSGQWPLTDLFLENARSSTTPTMVDPAVFGLFAVRLGIDARQAIEVVSGTDLDTIAEVLQQRGPEYVADFITAWFAARDHHFYSPLHYTDAVALSQLVGVTPLNQASYLHDWASAATGILNDQHTLPAVFMKQLSSHLEAAHNLGIADGYSFLRLLSTALAAGEVSHTFALAFSIDALEQCQTATQRKKWAAVIADHCAKTVTDLLPYAARIAAVASALDTAVVEKLVVPLLTVVPETELVELTLPAIYAPVKQAKRAALKALIDRTIPGASVCDELQYRITELSDDADLEISQLAQTLLTHWRGESPVVVPNPDVPRLWHATPPLWEVPRFERGTASLTTLTESFRHIKHRLPYACDSHVERFLALAVECAQTDEAATRKFLRSTAIDLGWGYPDIMTAWTEGRLPSGSTDPESKHTERVLPARNAAVIAYLGQLPCLLSEPSYQDLSINVDDLLHRLERYQEAAIPCLEPDLILALCRLKDVATSTAVHKRAHKITVTIRLFDGTDFDYSAGQVLADYLEQPISEPELFLRDDSSMWRLDQVFLPSFFKYLPLGLIFSDSWEASQAQFPTFHEVGGRSISNSGWELCPDVQAQLAANRAQPLSPATAINLLSLACCTKPAFEPTIIEGIHQCWERGLLQPNTADLLYLDWDCYAAQDSSTIAPFARALGRLSAEGLLSITWPLFDDILTWSQAAKTPLRCEAAVVKQMYTFAPSVVLAVEEGLAPQTALAPPGLTKVAARDSDRQANQLARRSLERLQQSQLSLL